MHRVGGDPTRWFSGYFAPVNDHSERVGDEDDADAPGEGDPDFASDRHVLEQLNPDLCSGTDVSRETYMS